MILTNDVEYGGYPLFNEIKNPTLRTWNRVNVIYNMKEFLRNNALAVKYAQQFTRNEQLAIHTMLLEIYRYGYEATRRTIIRGLNAA